MTTSKNYQPVQRSLRREFDIRGARYSVSEWGDPGAPLLIYLHGWADTGSTFQFVVDAMQRDWHIVAPDWRGFGRSTVDCHSYWFPDYLGDLDQLLFIYTPDEPARIVGHSMGANVAALYAGIRPQRVRSFVNVEGFGLADSDPSEAPARYRKWLDDARTAAEFSEYEDIAALARRIARRNPQMSEAQAAFVAAEWAEAQSDGRAILRADPKHKLPNPVLYRRAEAEACWQAIQAKVLLVTGGNSELASHFGGVAGASCPADREVCIDNAGHMLHFEASEELAAAVEAFLIEYL
ncbi:MAG: alpha/beta hydrolase [Woeseiaceae bacterium]|nr:alpha/beta hydrolase [Woeseiaceae bacterium]